MIGHTGSVRCSGKPTKSNERIGFDPLILFDVIFSRITLGIEPRHHSVSESALCTACGPALRRLASVGANDTRSQTRMALGQRIAAGLLALTVICMAAARYV